MTVRRVSALGNEGYGSFGQNVTLANSKYTFSMEAEAEFVNKFYNKAAPGTPQIVAVFSAIFLRWKFSLLGVNADLLKLYNAETQKSRLGTVITSHRGYVTDEVFVSFPNQMSRGYSTVIKSLIEGDEEGVTDEIPCDEPPSDEQLVIVNNALFITAGWYGSFFRGLDYSSNADICLCDKIEFYPESAVSAYTFGGSYYFFNFALNDENPANTQTPTINI